MKFLIDNALSPVLADWLRTHGHNAVHVRDLGLAAAADKKIAALATSEKRFLVSADMGFGNMLARSHADSPSVILFRGLTNRHPQRQLMLRLAHLHQLESDLQQGCIAVFDNTRLRIRVLPL